MILWQDDSINQIRVLKIGGIYRLVAVFDSGLILLWDPLQLSVYPLKLQYVPYHYAYHST